MRPILLRIEGLLSFRAPIEIDFEGRDHVAIIGDTGAGKSSILEAITYAFYGKPTFTGHGNQELMNDASTQLRVVLRFLVGGEIWEVTRTLRRSGDGNVTAARASLQRLDEDEEIVEQLEQVRAVNTRVTGLIGLDSDAFLRTVVLPQGRFGRLLVEDEPRERAAILRQVWQTEELEQAGRQVHRLLTELGPLEGRIEQELMGRPENAPAHLRELEARQQQAETTAAAAERTLDATRSAKARLDESEERAKVVHESETALEDHHLAAHLSTSERLATTAAEIAEEREKLSATRDRLVAEQAQIPQDDDGLSVAEVAGTRSELARLDERLGEVESLTGRLGLERADADAKDQAAEDAEIEAARVQEDLRARETERTNLSQTADRDIRRLSQAEALIELLRGAADAVAVAESQHSVIDSKRKELMQALLTATQASATAEETASAAGARLDQVRRENAAASAAHSLGPGDLCPVCKLPLSDDWQPPPTRALDDAQSAAHQSNEAAQSATREVTSLDTRLEESLIQSTGAEARTRGAAEGRDTAAAVLAAHLGIDASECVPPDDSLLDPLRVDATLSAAALTEFETDTDSLLQASSDAAAASQVARTNATNAAEIAARTMQDAADRLDLLRSDWAALPAVTRPAITLPVTPTGSLTVDRSPIAEALATLEARAAVLRARAEQRDALQVALEEVDGRIADLDARSQREVTDELSILTKVLDGHRDRLGAIVARLSLDLEAPPSVVGADAASVERITASLAEHDASLRAELQTEQQHLAAVRAETATDLQALAAQLGSSAPDPAGVLDAAEVAFQQALLEARTARSEASDFATIVEPLTSLAELWHEFTAKISALRDIAAALNDGAFPKWLTLRRSRSLLVHASRLLTEMSAGRYAFVDPKDDIADWRILANDSGQARSPASLSGGEQFVASLALALGMVEMMGRSGGRLESLFLDEGFGALDRTNLDAALVALAQVSATGRLVVVISHIRAVAEQLEHVLAVTRTATGTEARWLTLEERLGVSETESLSEISGAFAGLID